ncbi:thioredoxin H9-like isoform X2 [Telopea speciosissima]|uniref:thioredoxin H9-like isoform X2 n=1 Tax=Telopea speciosissima TaxID=54955 RepID=UPI001CC406A8|nr:thioredoxin H9-like isoform X2 [Telopea speciosissima]XP_043700557.1 thioredoxin H9-like isoform X2 [Telopea speciosissima]
MGNCVARNYKDESDADHAVNFASGNIHLITTKESWDEKISEANNSGKFVVVNFSASWCGPCRMLAPFYSELSEKYPSLMFVIVDVDELTEFSSSWDIRATPTFFILKDGQQVDKLVGANKPELLKKIIKIAESVTQDPK